MNTLLHSADKETTLSRILQVQSDSPSQWGKMTAHQMICHCTDQIRSAIGEIEVKDRSSFIERTLVKFLALYVIKMPKGKIETPSEYHHEKKGTRPVEFQKDQQELIASIHRFENATQFFPHPMLGSMTKKEWARLIYIHLDHHLRQFNV